MTDLWQPPMFKRQHPKAAVGCVQCSVCGRRLAGYRARLDRTELRVSRHDATGLTPRRDAYWRHCEGSYMAGRVLGTS